MKFEKKTVSIILVATIGLSLFVGSALALPAVVGGRSPFAEILELLLGINDKADNVTRSLDTIPVILGSYASIWKSTSIGEGVVEDSRITTDKPAIFTVTVSVMGYVDAGDVVWLAQSINHGLDWSTNVGQPLRYPDDNCMTWTVAGYGVTLTYYDFTTANMEIGFCIIVQGDRDTDVQVG